MENTKISFRFLNSVRFMDESLDKLSSFLDPQQKILPKNSCNNETEYQLLQRKGVFPYDFLDDWAKLKQNKLHPQ